MQQVISFMIDRFVILNSRIYNILPQIQGPRNKNQQTTTLKVLKKRLNVYPYCRIVYLSYKLNIISGILQEWCKQTFLGI